METLPPRVAGQKRLSYMDVLFHEVNDYFWLHVILRGRSPYGYIRVLTRLRFIWLLPRCIGYAPSREGRPEFL